QDILSSVLAVYLPSQGPKLEVGGNGFQAHRSSVRHHHRVKTDSDIARTVCSFQMSERPCACRYYDLSIPLVVILDYCDERCPDCSTDGGFDPGAQSRARSQANSPVDRWRSILRFQIRRSPIRTHKH